MNVSELKIFGAKRFQKHLQVTSLWQYLADHFYPERADFTQTHNLGEELGVGLSTSQPVLIRRELSNSIGAMLRDGQWFNVGVEQDPDHMGKMWLEYATHRMFKLINQRATNFRRATKEGDHDYCTFGQAVISIQLNKRGTGLTYRTWHLRDCAFWDDDEGQVDGVVRNWKPKLYEVKKFFKDDEISPEVKKKLKDPARMFDDLHIQHFDITTEMYDQDGFQKFERMSIYLDVANEHIMREVGTNHRTYVVPRFQTISGSPYAYSPATVVGLPEARTLQAMTHTLLEAGERYARPPLLAREKVIRGDANLTPDGITYISETFDSRMHGGEALKPLSQDMRGFPYAVEMREGVIEVLQAAFYVNKMNLPETTHEMTAYEVQERMKQYRRENLPLFAPIEHEYNGQLCEISFDILMANGLLGSHQDIPKSLHDKEVVFKFVSPLSEADEEKKTIMFSEVSKLLAEAAEFDDGVIANIEFDEALRDAVAGTGAPTTWLAQVDEVGKRREGLQAQRAAALAAEQQGAAA
jgi:hypothetical protein